MDSAKFEQQLSFILEIDKLKHIIRKSFLMDGETLEDDAQHSWHIATAAIILVEYANNPNLDLLKCLKMLVIHDIVEIDAGDVFAYAEDQHPDKFEKELKAAKRIFGLLPEPLNNELKELWIEFEKSDTDEAKFAHTVDSFLPILLNFNTKGKQWRKYNVTPEMVLKRNHFIKEGSEQIWKFIVETVEKGKSLGYFDID